MEPEGSIYLPNNETISSYLNLEEVKDILEKYYRIEYLVREDCKLNPLFQAGFLCEDLLLQGQNCINENQLEDLDKTFPFVKLTRLVSVDNDNNDDNNSYIAGDIEVSNNEVFAIEDRYYNDFKVEVIANKERLENFRSMILDRKRSSSSQFRIEDYLKIDSDRYLATRFEISADYYDDRNRFEDFMMLGVGILLEDNDEDIIILQHADILEAPYGIFICATIEQTSPDSPIDLVNSNVYLQFLMIPLNNTCNPDHYNIKSISLPDFIMLTDNFKDYHPKYKLDETSDFFKLLQTYQKYDLSLKRSIAFRNREISKAIVDQQTSTNNNDNNNNDNTQLLCVNKKRKIDAEKEDEESDGWIEAS